MSLSVSDRVMLHMSRFGGIQFDEFGMPYELTEDGIGSCIGKSRAHVSIELKRLQEKGLVEWRNAHVNGVSKMRKTFTLTVSGYAMLDSIKQKMINEGLTLDQISYKRLDGNKCPVPELEIAYRNLQEATEMMYSLREERRPNLGTVVDVLTDTIKILAFTNMRENGCSTKDDQKGGSKEF